MVYDCTNKASFEHLIGINEAVKKANNKDVPGISYTVSYWHFIGVVISTKNDLGNIKTVSIAEGNELAKKINDKEENTNNFWILHCFSAFHINPPLLNILPRNIPKLSIGH